MRTSFFLLLPLFLLASCAPYYRYQPAAEQPDLTTTYYHHGLPTLRSQLNGADISADLSIRGKRDMTLSLFVQNAGLQAFDVFPEDIRVSGYDAAGNKVPLKVLTAEQAIRRKRNRNLAIAGIAVAATVATVAVAANNLDSPKDPDDYYHYNYEADFWYSVAAVPTVVLETSALVAAAQQSAPPPAAPFRSPDGLLRRHTLFPEERLEGIVKIRARPDLLAKIEVEVPVEGGYAQFTFDRRKRPF